MSTGPGVGGIEVSVPDSDGPVNLEDYLISYALGVPYTNQHPPMPAAHARGRPDRPSLADPWPARCCADRAIAEAEARAARIGVAIVDELGQVMQVDRMDGAPLAATDLAEAKALTALEFQRPSGELSAALGPGMLDSISRAVHFNLVALAGGVPLRRDGAGQADDHAIASAAAGEEISS